MHRLAGRTALATVAFAALAAPLAWADPPSDAASSPSAPPPAPGHCRAQSANPDLIRGNYVPIGGPPDVARRRAELRTAADRYRTEHYGYFTGFGSPTWNAHPPSFYAEVTHFFAVAVRVNRRIIPALACVEGEITRSCAATPYRPGRLVGLRPNNSFHGGEVSNHVYGMAIDVDPQRNPCCGCGTMFRDHPGCTRHASTVWARMEMPPCWVHSFERYGFYWLGNDHALRDLMHFEFLGDPDHITD